jgi:hypothetical protein
MSSSDQTQKLAAKRIVLRLSGAISAAFSEHYKSGLPGKVDSVSRLSYVLGLRRALEIVMEEINTNDSKPKNQD